MPLTIEARDLPRPDPQSGTRPNANSDSNSACPHSDTGPDELAGLIRKLRWARLDHEAERLEVVMRRFPQEQRGTVFAGPFSTD